MSQEPFWKRRIQRDINELRRTVGKLDRYAKGQIKNMKKLEQIFKKHHVKKKGVKVVMEELKQRITAKAAKIDRYEKRINQFRINRMFSSNQKRVFVELNDEVIKENTVPNADESRTFWSEIWDNPVEHNHDAEWLREIETESKGVNKQDDVKITAQDVRKQTGKIPNWKAAGPDGVQGYWLKNFSSLHDRIACQLNAVVESGDVPAWMTYGRTVLCVKDRSKGNAASNFRPISCLPIMWKLLTGMLSEQLYKHVDTNDMLPSEQKGCRKETRGTKDQLLIDRMVLKNCKRRHTNLAMAYVDYKKAYDMIPHSWILKSLQLVGAADNIVNVLEKSMTKWKVRLNAGDKVLGDVNVKRGIFQGDSLSPLLFVICLIPMSLILRKMKAGYSLGKNQPKLNHLLYMDDLKLFGQSERDIESLVNTVHRFSCDIGMRFGIEKCGVIIMKRGKMITCDGMELPDGEKMKGVSEEGYKYLGIVELDGIKEKEMKGRFTKEYKRRIKLILKSNLNSRNAISAMNIWAVAVMRYGAGIVKWTKEELEKLDRQTRKIMMMNGALHPKSDVDRLYVARQRGGRGLQSVLETVQSEENSLRWYVKNSQEQLLKAVHKQQEMNTDIIKPSEYKYQRKKEREVKWHEKVLHGQFFRDTDGIVDRKKSWLWLKNGDLKKGTEALIMAAQEQAIRTNYVKHHVDKSRDSPSCRMCGEMGETVSHIICECSKLTQKKYKRCHDNVARIVHWEICKKYDLPRAEQWYNHKPEGVTENESIKVLWDFNINTDYEIEHRRPDIVVVLKPEKECLIIDIAVPGDTRIKQKEQEKIEKYQDLKREIARLWCLRKVTVIPVVVGALGCVTKEAEQYIEKIGIKIRTEVIQITALLGTARTLRKVLET